MPPVIPSVAKKEPPDRSEPLYTIQPAQDDDDLQDVVAVKTEPLSSNINENIQEGSSNTYKMNTEDTYLHTTLVC